MPFTIKDQDCTHIRQDCSNLVGHFTNHVFYDCIFKNFNGLVLEHCDLNNSRFVADTLEDALGLTVTLDCLSFNEVELSPLVFDLMLCLLIKTKGNADKRSKLLEVLGRDRAKELLNKMKTLE